MIVSTSNKVVMNSRVGLDRCELFLKTPTVDHNCVDLWTGSDPVPNWKSEGPCNYAVDYGQDVNVTQSKL